MNKVFKILLLSGIVISIITGNYQKIDLVILHSIEKGIAITYKVGIGIILWSGLLNVLVHQPYFKRLNDFFLPIINLIFPNLSYKSKARESILSNFLCNFFGIGAAATPAALLAIKELKKEEDYQSIIHLTLLNTTSMSVIPLSLISYLQVNGSNPPFKLLIIYPLITIFSIAIVIIFNRRSKLNISV